MISFINNRQYFFDKEDEGIASTELVKCYYCNYCQHTTYHANNCEFTFISPSFLYSYFNHNSHEIFHKIKKVVKFDLFFTWQILVFFQRATTWPSI